MKKVKNLSVEIRLRKTLESIGLTEDEYDELKEAYEYDELYPTTELYDKLMSKIDLADFDDIEVSIEDYED